MPQSRCARRLIEKLNKPIGLLDGYLCETAMLVENAKQVTFGNFFGGQVSYKMGGTRLQVSSSVHTRTHAHRHLGVR